MRVLIGEDGPRLADSIARGRRDSACATGSVGDGDSAARQAARVQGDNCDPSSGLIEVYFSRLRKINEGHDTSLIRTRRDICCLLGGES